MTESVGITIVIPVLNPQREELLALKQLVTVIDQSSLVTEVIIANDSHKDLPEQYLAEVNTSDVVKVVAKGVNQGRGGAINYGASFARSSHIWILDADCFVDRSTLEALPGKQLSNVDVLYGAIDAQGQDPFWDRYQKNRRSVRAQSGEMQFTTANLIIRRKLFEAIGGFDFAYQHYGFEDRDLIERFPANLVIQYEQGFVVRHDGNITLPLVRRKMFSSAASAQVFREKFPARYSQISYSGFDYNCIGFPKRLIFSMLEKLERALSGVLDYCIKSHFVPFAIKKLIVLFASSMAFYRGTALLAKASNDA